MKKVLIVLAINAIYLTVFITINTIHFLYFRVQVVLYDTILDAFLAAVVFSLIYFALFYSRSPLNGLETVLSIALGLSIAAGYAISVPTVIDRSLSVYILEKLAQRGGAIRMDAFPGIFINEYMKEQRLVDIRLTEQLASGTITIANGCVELTERGRIIAQLTRFYRTHILPKQRNIMGVYTDDLTDPFRNSVAADYGCDPEAIAPSEKTK